MRQTLRWISVFLAAAGAVVGSVGCDHGLAPPDLQPPGAIHGTIRYSGEWPPEAQFRDLRFVAMRFVPRDTSDFLDLNRMAISGRLRYGVSADTFLIAGVEPGVFFYSGVAQQYSPSLLDWRPIGLVTAGDGTFEVDSGITAEVEIDVDLSNRPPFPPQ